MNRAYSVFTVTKVDEAAGTIIGMATTPDLDRHGDVVEPRGAQFLLPMPLLLGHDHNQPIGAIEAARVTAAGIEIVAKLTLSAGERIREVWELIRAGALRGLSVGFRPRKAEPIPGGGNRFTEWDLFEVSVVAVPANSAATISNIIGVDASIEPSFGNLSVKSNLSGEFTVVNEYLVRDLKQLGLWDDVMVMDLKHFDGSLRPIDRVPEDLKRLYGTAFEVDASWLVEAGARRQKWIDQAQSLNVYMAGASGRKLDETYKLAWLRGLKTTYYLRTTSATYAEKSTVARGALNAVSNIEAGGVAAIAQPATDVKFCAIDNPDCEACQ